MGDDEGNPLEGIEQKDFAIAERLGRAVTSIHSSLGDFRKLLQIESPDERDTSINSLHDALEAMLQEALIVMDDMRKIYDIEASESKYSIPDDDELLNDKLNQMKRVKNVIESMIELLDENPNLSEYAGEYLETMGKDLGEVENDFRKILQDDEELSLIYQSLYPEGESPEELEEE